MKERAIGAMERIPGRPLLFGILGIVLALHGMFFYYNWNFARQGYSDFIIFYTAGKIIDQGFGSHLYDPELQFQTQQNIAPEVQNRKGPLPYNHPPFEALLFVPFTWLDYSSALAAWGTLNLLILALVPFIIRPCIPLIGKASFLSFLILLAFPPTLGALVQGQDAIVLLFLYALTFAALKKNVDALAGLWLGLGTFRFHLIVPFVVILFFLKRTKALQSFFATTAVLVFISVLTTGWAEAHRYPKYVFHLEEIGGAGGIFPIVMPNLRGLIQGWPVADKFPVAVQLVVVALSLGLLLWVIVILRKVRSLNHQFDLQFSLIVVATILVSYHTYSYDLIVLALPVFLLANRFTKAGELRGKRNLILTAILGLLFCTPLYLFLGNWEKHLNLIAVVLLLLLFEIRKEILAEFTSPRTV